MHYKWVKAEKKRKKALKKGKGKKKKKKKKKVAPDAVTDADGVANINTTLGMDEEEPENNEEDMEGDMEEGDKGEGDDENESPDKEDGESPSKSPRDGEGDEVDEGSKSPRANLLSIASANKGDFQPVLDDDQLNIELHIERSMDDRSDIQKL